MGLDDFIICDTGLVNRIRPSLRLAFNDGLLQSTDEQRVMYAEFKTLCQGLVDLGFMDEEPIAAKDEEYFQEQIQELKAANGGKFFHDANTILERYGVDLAEEIQIVADVYTQFYKDNDGMYHKWHGESNIRKNKRLFKEILRCEFVRYHSHRQWFTI